MIREFEGYQQNSIMVSLINFLVESTIFLMRLISPIFQVEGDALSLMIDLPIKMVRKFVAIEIPLEILLYLRVSIRKINADT